MTTKVIWPEIARPRSKVSYALMARFTELLICSRCFSQRVQRPVRQLISSHHRPLALCHECSREVLAQHKARVLKFN
jgi:hypothetical protein